MSMYAYSLTKLTGKKKNNDRTIIVATVEVNQFTFAVTVAAAVLSLLPTVGIGMLLGPFWSIALVIPFLFIGAGLLFVDQRSKGGLRLRRYQSIFEARNAKKTAGTIYVCGVPLVEPVIGNIIPQFIDAAPEVEHAAVGKNVSTRDGKVSFLHA